MYNITTLLKEERDSDSIRVEKRQLEYDTNTIPREISKIRKKTIKLLIVYNKENLCKMLETSLIKRGLDCIGVVDARIGLSLIEREKFDAVLLDLMMPGFSGYDIIDALEKNGKLKENNIIIFTAVHHSQSEIEDLLERGVYSYLRQPVRLDALVRILETV